MPFRYQYLFWEQKFKIEIWRGNNYAAIVGEDLISMIKIAIQAWKGFAFLDKLKEKNAPR
jgi:hypothetical protein